MKQLIQNSMIESGINGMNKFHIYERNEERENKQKMKDLCIRTLIYGGIDEKEYQEVTDLVREKNKETLSMITLPLSILFLGLFIGSCIFPVMASGQIFYLASLVLMAVLYFILRVVPKKTDRLILPVWYVLLTGICGYAMALNTYLRPDLPSTTFCVVLIAAPLLIIDKPYRLLGYLTAVWGVFIFFVWHIKSYYLAFVDTCNSLCCLLLGIALYIHIIQVKMREMLQRQQLRRERDTDKLTGLQNKAAIEHSIKEYLNDGHHKGALLMMDIDKFKYYNDTYGHAFGDAVLATVGQSISRCFRQSDLCGRFGGDEFVVFLTGEVSGESILQRLDLFRRFVAEHIAIPDENNNIEFSIGVAFCSEVGNNYQELFQQADSALYRAKNEGKNRCCFYDR